MEGAVLKLLVGLTLVFTDVQAFEPLAVRQASIDRCLPWCSVLLDDLVSLLGLQNALKRPFHLTEFRESGCWAASWGGTSVWACCGGWYFRTALERATTGRMTAWTRWGGTGQHNRRLFCGGLIWAWLWTGSLRVTGWWLWLSLVIGMPLWDSNLLL